MKYYIFSREQMIRRYLDTGLVPYHLQAGDVGFHSEINETGKSPYKDADMIGAFKDGEEPPEFTLDPLSPDISQMRLVRELETDWVRLPIRYAKNVIAASFGARAVHLRPRP